MITRRRNWIQREGKEAIMLHMMGFAWLTLGDGYKRKVVVDKLSRSRKTVCHQQATLVSQLSRAASCMGAVATTDNHKCPMMPSALQQKRNLRVNLNNHGEEWILRRLRWWGRLQPEPVVRTGCVDAQLRGRVRSELRPHCIWFRSWWCPESIRVRKTRGEASSVDVSSHTFLSSSFANGSFSKVTSGLRIDKPKLSNCLERITSSPRDS